MTDQKNDEATNDDLLGDTPAKVETPDTPQTSNRDDAEASVDPVKVEEDTPAPDKSVVRESPLPGAPVVDGKVVGDPDYPYDLVMEHMNREAGQLTKHAQHLSKISGYVLQYKAKFQKRLSLAELNNKNQKLTRHLQDNQRAIQAQLIKLAADAGLTPPIK